MIHSITVINHLGDSIKLELTRPDKTGFIVGSVDGLGPPKATINTTKTATADGAVYNSAFVDVRNITMSLTFQETNYKTNVGGKDVIVKESIEDIRLKSYKYFPVKRNVELIIETDNRLVRTVGYVESNEPSIFTQQAGCDISIICPDPLLYAYDIDNVAFYGVQPAFEFAFSNESITKPLLELGIIENKTENVIFYEGDSEIGFTIIIHAIGDVSNITIFNVVTREKISITFDMVAGDTIYINTKKGQKSASLLREGLEYNVLNTLGKNVDWFTLRKGENRFAFTAESGKENLQFSIVHELVYDGI